MLPVPIARHPGAPATRGEDRRTAIADAAITVVARNGLRGLTHRAVDAVAGLPSGSTSYYLRTRRALVGACFDRMVERDLTEPLGADEGSGDLAELLARFVTAQVRHRRDVLVARYELSLEAARHADLREQLTRAGERVRAGLAVVLSAHGIADARRAAWPVAAMLDGLMYDRIAGAGSLVTDAEFEAAVYRAAAALVDGLRTASTPG
jgi:DNA-binding transcriptional regulator YbjK